MTKKRILVVEDEKDLAELIGLNLQREGYAVELAGDGPGALENANRDPPHLVLLDIMLPTLSGREVAAELKRDPRTARVPIIMLTARAEEEEIVAGLRLGADDYVTKPFNMKVLLARVAAMLRRSDGGVHHPKSVLMAGDLRIDTDQYRVELDGAALPLTLTEFRILLALASARGRVLNRDQLVAQAMGPNCIVTDRTIDVHITSLRRKLGRARGCIHTVRGVGYRFERNPDEAT